MDFRYARPPPPPSSDPHQPPPQQQPVPPPPGWYSGQFQYHSPSPPPPQWAPQQQHSDHHLPPPPYGAAPPPPMPYSSNPYPLPPRPHMPPPPPQPHYPPVNQEWSNTNWGRQGWDYSAQNKNEDDWAARARAWAASKSVTDDQHQHSQIAPANRPEGINYQDQHSQNSDPPYTEFQQHPHPPSNYQQYSSPFAPPPRPPAYHMQEPPSFSSAYASDGHFSYTARGGNGNMRDPAAASYPHQESAPTSLSVHQQEVPSSYSSVAGKEETRETNNGKYYQPPPHTSFASAPQHQIQPQVEQPHYSFSNPSAAAEPPTDLSNQPLDFGPRFGHDHDPYGQSKYGNESVGPPMPSITPWTSSAPQGMPYPPMPPAHLTVQQGDPSMGVPSPASMHSAPLFGGMGGSSFQPPSNASFHSTNAFPGETYGGFPERPKKASVPNWLREEIIKKKAVIGSATATEVARDDNESNEDDIMDPSFGKGDQADGKSIESSRSTEEEDDDEDVEAARTAAINQEIKRILTEVLLKVTDELFDEIATKVLDEDDLKVEVERKAIASSDMISASLPAAAVPAPKSSAKILIPTKTKGNDLDDASGKSSSSSPGDVLGLGSYASDEDDEDNEVQNSSILIFSNSKPTENGSSRVEKNKSHGVEHPHDNSSGEKVQDNSNVSKSKQIVEDNNSLPDDSRSRSPKRSSSKDYNDEVEKVNVDNKIQDERHVKRTKKDKNQNGSEERAKDRDLVKRVTKDDKTEIDKDRRSHGKEDSRKRERVKDEKNDQSSRHKRRQHSPSPGDRGRSSKENSSVSHSSDDSRRKVHSNRRDLSPSPVRSRRRVSRSPSSSKRSHRRHSNYSSLDSTRERDRDRKRSRSRSRSRRG